MAKIYLKNDKTGNRYEVVRMDNAKTPPEVVLKGENSSVEFTEPFDKEKFKRMGYSLVKEEEG